MPREIKNHEEKIDVFRRTEVVSELVEKLPNGEFKNELDIDVIVFGRNYAGKKVGPYARLLEFQLNEIIVLEDAWETNLFYILVEGSLDVTIIDETGIEKKVGEIKQGNTFGEMAVLAGTRRNATVKAPPDSTALVLELTRPALRLLRKLPKFGKVLDRSYRKYGLDLTLNDIKNFSPESFNQELLKQLGDSARFVVYEKNHVLFHERDPINRLVFVRNGWIQRVSGADFNPAVADFLLGTDKDVGLDFLGAGSCLGLEALENKKDWAYTATVLGRTEVLEVAVSRLRESPDLAKSVITSLGESSKADNTVKPEPPVDKRVIDSTNKVIETGLVDTTNLLVMDMDKCIRCGNCSLACQHVHGNSRLLRRGIHIERPVKPKSYSIQDVLVPSVCLHCQDPECLTGCPTGAIGRYPDGQIDINKATCIGCGDCATQCPYNAITMVPRDQSSDKQKDNFFRKAFAEIFSLKPAMIPKPVTQTEDLLAIKCNLCQGTPLNPANATRKTYSCEESCPTGALVRVNPREYFSEVKNTLGLIYKDQTHAIGRNIHQRDVGAILWHIFGIMIILAGGYFALWGTLKFSQDALLLPDSWLTMRWITGLLGLGGITWVMLYPLRKQIYRHRAGALRYWMLTHIYLGILAGFVLLIHGGTTSTGLLTTLLMISFDLVIASGIFGVFCYIVVPRIMTSIEGEPLLLEDLQQRREELRAKLAEISESDTNPELQNLVKTRVKPLFLSLGYLLRQYFKKEDLKTMLARAREKFKMEAESLGRSEGVRLIAAVEDAATLRRIDALCYLHRLLKLWVAPHVFFTSLMLILMVVHIVQVVYFNVR